MTDAALDPRAPGAPEWWEPKTPLGHARALLEAGRPREAHQLLEDALESDALSAVSNRAAALLALALLAEQSDEGDDALRLLLRAEAELALARETDHIVRFDVALAKARLLAASGRTAEAAGCAQAAIAAFEDSDLSVAFSRPVLLALREYASADGAYDAAFMVPRAVGALQLDDELDAGEWVALQRAVLDELDAKGSRDTAARHVATVILAAPFDLLGMDGFWHEVTQLLGRVRIDSGALTQRVLIDAFNLLEYEFDRALDYEEEAPLLPRERTVARW